MARDSYAAQVSLLVRVLPYVAREKVFALKGGTAINMFYRDLPRLSVDIDLAYLPVKDRTESLDDIEQSLDRIAALIETGIRGAQARRIPGGGGGATRIIARLNNVEVKIETSPVTRGVVHEPELKAVTAVVEAEFGFAEVQVVSFEDLFAGKIAAAMDRQHPRDLFDVKLLYANEGLTDKLFRTFLVYVASSRRPSHELLNPHLTDLSQIYAREFVGMTKVPVACEELGTTRSALVADIQGRFNESTRHFLRTLHDGDADFAAIDMPGAADLPAVLWKQLNLRKLKRENPRKHSRQRDDLESVLDNRPKS